MWLAALILFVELCVRLLLRGAPALWLALLVGAIVLGGQPDHPLAALIGASAAFVCAKLARRAIAERAHGR